MSAVMTFGYTEVTKVNVESVCAFAKTLSRLFFFPGPLPNLPNLPNLTNLTTDKCLIACLHSTAVSLLIDKLSGEDLV